jgi:hypothetical protein
LKLHFFTPSTKIKAGCVAHISSGVRSHSPLSVSLNLRGILEFAAPPARRGEISKILRVTRCEMGVVIVCGLPPSAASLSHSESLGPRPSITGAAVHHQEKKTHFSFGIPGLLQ